MKKDMSPNQRLFLIGLYLCLFIFSVLFCHAVYQEKQHIHQHILHQQSVKIVHGEIKKFQNFYAGKGGEQAKIKLTGLKKWLMLGKVSDAEAKQLQTGQIITIEVYPPNNGLLSKAYNVQHTLRTLGIKTNNQTIRTHEAAKHHLMNSNRMFMIAAIFMLVVSLVGLYFTYKSKVRKGS